MHARTKHCFFFYFEMNTRYSRTSIGIRIASLAQLAERWSEAVVYPSGVGSNPDSSLSAFSQVS